METPDYRQYIARLRAIGCPEQTIRDLIIADLDKLYSARIRNLVPLRRQLNYWESEEAELANNHDARAWQRQEREIEREKAQVVKDLLGVDLAAERQRIRGQVDKYDRRLAFLPEGKRAELRAMIETWEEQEQAIREKAWDSGTVPAEEDRARLRTLRIEREQALSESLTPGQREMFDLWMSPTAEALRHDLYGMGATEQDFKSLYQLRKDFDATWPRDEIDTSDPSTLEAWGTALLDLETRVKEVLGEDRFAMYQRGQDSQFHELNSTASRFNLPREKAAEAYEYLRLSQMERDRVTQSGAFTPDQQAAILARIQSETDRALQELLGPGPFHYFQQRTR